MTRVLSSPVLVLSLVLLLIATLSTHAAETNATISVGQQQCTACRDSDSCTTAYLSAPGSFCYDCTETLDATSKTAYCCSATEICTVSTTDYVCESPKTPKRVKTLGPTPAPTKADSSSSTMHWVMFGVVMIVVCVATGFDYFYCMKRQTKKAMVMLEDASYNGAMTIHQHQQLQHIYAQQQYSPQQHGGRASERNGHSAL